MSINDRKESESRALKALIARYGSRVLLGGDKRGRVQTAYRARKSTSETHVARPATFAGVQFRSRLEARWAFFLTEVGLRWEYEPRKLSLCVPVADRPRGWDSSYRLWYIPDFLLPGVTWRGCANGVWLEVKPSWMAHCISRHAKELVKMRALSAFAGTAYMVCGAPFKWDAGGNAGVEYTLRKWSQGREVQRDAVLEEFCEEIGWRRTHAQTDAAYAAASRFRLMKGW